METLNKKTLSFPFKSSAKFLAVFGVLFMLAACGNKGGGGGTVTTTPVVVGVEGCQNCGTISNPINIVTFKSASPYVQWSGVELTNMKLFVSGTNFTPGISAPYNTYSGPVSVQGQLVVGGSSPLTDYAGCSIAPGIYAIQTYSVGSISQGTDFIVPELIATSPAGVSVRLRMTKGFGITSPVSMLLKESEGVYRWMGRLEIISVNGQGCSPLYSDMR